jgi:hypothetical protein
MLVEGYCQLTAGYRNTSRNDFRINSVKLKPKTLADKPSADKGKRKRKRSERIVTTLEE